MLIKICGLTDVETAVLAVEKGAQYIGLLFSKVSPRAISLEKGKEIGRAVREAGGEPVVVFVDETLPEMESIIKELDLKLVQLHGNNSRSLCDALPSHLQKIYAVDGNPIPKSLDPKRDFLLFDRRMGDPLGFRFFFSGGLHSENVRSAILEFSPDGVDVSSGVEKEKGIKDPLKVEAFIQKVRPGRFGSFGGMYAPEILIAPLKELESAFNEIVQSSLFQKELGALLRNYAGRPTALTEVPRFAAAIQGPRIFLKREDLLHTGAHKISNAIGQCLLAKKMGKTRVIAETGAGQHGVATATAAAFLGLECVIYMGQTDIERQAPNVAKMTLLGAKVIPVTQGSQTLKEAVNEAMREWSASFETTHYCLGSALGPHPFPAMVASFQAVIGTEAKQELRIRIGRDPDLAIACVGGGSNAIGLFSAYLNEPHVRLIGVEAGGVGRGLGNHAARFLEGSPGVLHGTYTYLLQDSHGQIGKTHSISAGLDYPGVGPQHAALHQSGRAQYDLCTDEEALAAFQLLAQTEGIIPALESSHALGFLIRIAPTLAPDAVVLVNLSGRGDKDLPKLLEEGLLHVAH